MHVASYILFCAHSASTTTADLVNSSLPDDSFLSAAGKQKRVTTLKSPADISVSLIDVTMQCLFICLPSKVQCFALIIHAYFLTGEELGSNKRGICCKCTSEQQVRGMYVILSRLLP